MLKTNWCEEVKKFTNLSVRAVDSKFDYTSIPDVIVSSYENVKNIPVDVLPNTIVLDESHFIKNMKAKKNSEDTRIHYCYKTRVSGSLIWYSNHQELHRVLFDTKNTIYVSFSD